MIDYQTIKKLEDYLDVLEDEKESIPKEDKNNIERCQKKLLASLNKCKNKDDIQVDIEIIQDSFNNILKV